MYAAYMYCYTLAVSMPAEQHSVGTMAQSVCATCLVWAACQCRGLSAARVGGRRAAPAPSLSQLGGLQQFRHSCPQTVCVCLLGVSLAAATTFGAPPAAEWGHAECAIRKHVGGDRVRGVVCKGWCLETLGAWLTGPVPDSPNRSC